VIFTFAQRLVPHPGVFVRKTVPTNILIFQLISSNLMMESLLRFFDYNFDAIPDIKL
jgi:hypothetical protein